MSVRWAGWLDWLDWWSVRLNFLKGLNLRLNSPIGALVYSNHDQMVSRREVTHTYRLLCPCGCTSVRYDSLQRAYHPSGSTFVYTD